MVLAESRAGTVRPPASMVKMLMMLLVAEGVEAGDWTLDRQLTVSRKAQSIGGSQVYLEAGEVFTLEQLIRAVAIGSANDAAMAVAEGLWGSEEAYLARMNERARELGMVGSTFYSVHGLPPDAGEKVDQSTARDMAVLAQWCVRQPLVMKWVGERELRFRTDKIAKHNTNKLLWRMDDCDGLKTGYTRAAGFCLAATAQRNGIRLITVVMGHTNKWERFRHAQRMLEEGFQRVRRHRILARGETLEQHVRVRNSARRSVALRAADDVWVVTRADAAAELEVVAAPPAELIAPVPAGTPVGQAEVRLEGRTVATVALVVPEDVPEAGWRWILEESALREF
jgi:D-alanyl-D-alanine carboxypeptidase (penicillin-binding protein 5/6)